MPRYTSSRLEPTIMTWTGIWNMIWVAAITLRRDLIYQRVHAGKGPRMTVTFSRQEGDALVRLEAEAL